MENPASHNEIFTDKLFQMDNDMPQKAELLKAGDPEDLEMGAGCLKNLHLPLI